jgi:hypothetical protein
MKYVVALKKKTLCIMGTGRFAISDLIQLTASYLLAIVFASLLIESKAGYVIELVCPLKHTKQN